MNEDELYFASDFFVYGVTFSTLTSGSSNTAPINIQADSDFFLSKLAVFATDVNDLPIANNDGIAVNVLITDTGSGRNLANIAVPVSSFFGSGQLPFILPRQRIFLANTTINVQVTNFGAGDYNALSLSFIGEKKFRRGRA